MSRGFRGQRPLTSLRSPSCLSAFIQKTEPVDPSRCFLIEYNPHRRDSQGFSTLEQGFQGAAPPDVFPLRQSLGELAREGFERGPIAVCDEVSAHELAAHADAARAGFDEIAGIFLVRAADSQQRDVP